MSISTWTLLSRGVLGALTRYVLGDKVANWYDIPREPVWSPLLETACCLSVCAKGC